MSHEDPKLIVTKKTSENDYSMIGCSAMMLSAGIAIAAVIAAGAFAYWLVVL